MSELKIFYNDAVDWVVAESSEDASAVWDKHTGDCAAEYDMEWDEMQPNEFQTITYEDVRDETPWPKDATIIINKHNRYEVTASVLAWIEWNGRGFLCSTEW